MNEAPADLLGLAGPNPAKAGAGLTDGQKRSEGWSPNRWLAVILLVFATHIALVFLFGEKKLVVPRAVTRVPTLSLAHKSDALLALKDPTLFALPHRRDFGSAVWLKRPEIKPPSFRWTESPRPLLLAADGLGAGFVRMMQTNAVASPPLDFKPALTLSTPSLPAEPMLPQNSTMRIEGELAQRQLPPPGQLTNWPYANVIAPSVVQVLVDPAGEVVSTVLLPPGSGYTRTDQYDAADQCAIAIARTLRFTPAAGLTLGRIIFNWHTVPPETDVNAPE